MVSRVAHSIMGQSYWQRAFKENTDDPSVNTEFVRKVEPYVVTVIGVLIFIGVILDIIVWRWRYLAKWLFYLELLNRFVLGGFCPFDYGGFRTLIFQMLNISNFVCFVTNPGPNIIASTVMSVLTEVVYLQSSLTFQTDTKIANVVVSAFQPILCFSILTTFGMFVTYLV